MKVLFAYEGKLKDHGLDLVAREQLKALSQGGHKTTVVSRGSWSLPSVEFRNYRWTPASILSWTKKETYYAAQQRMIAWLAAGELTQGRRPNLVIGWQRAALALFQRAAKLRIPRVLCCASSTAIHASLADVPRWPRIGNDYLRKEFELADLILTPSEKVKEIYVSQGLEESKIVSIERGYDPKLFFPSPTPEPGFRVFFCGRICARKGAEQLLAAWDRAAIPGGELWLAGAVDGIMEPLVANYRERKDVRFLGFRHDIAELMRKCHVHALLSRVESMGKSLIEASASGLVNVTTSGVGFPIQDKVTGIIVDRDNLSEVAAAFKMLAEQPETRRRIAEAGKTFVEAEYTWQKFRSRFLDAIEGLR